MTRLEELLCCSYIHTYILYDQILFRKKNQLVNLTFYICFKCAAFPEIRKQRFPI